MKQFIDDLAPDVEPKQKQRCVCDVEFGTCPGRQQCPYSGEEDEDDAESE